MAESSDIGALLDEVVRPFLDLPCCGGKLYLGSMFFLDFGALLPTLSRSGNPIQVGEMTLGLRDVDWQFYCGDQLFSQATTVTKDIFCGLLSYLERARIRTVLSLGPNQTLEFLFDNDCRLSVDLTNRFGTELDILGLTLPDERYVSIDQKCLLSVQDLRNKKTL